MGGKGKRKIEMKRIFESERRFVTFCKRRKGMFKKAEELASLTGAHVAALVFSPSVEKPHTCGDMMVIERYINDTCADQLSTEPEIINIDAVLQKHASTNLEDINDLNVLTEWKSELMVIRDSLLQSLT